VSLDRLTHDLPKIVFVVHEPQPAGLQSRDVEQIVDDSA